MSKTTTKIQIVSASAGTGKTYRLAEELADSILSERARPEAVVAITYTRKAAAELARRLRKRLVQAGRHDAAARVRDGYLGTVHSVCERLLSEFAFEIGRSPRVDALPESYSDQLFAEVTGTVVDEALDSLAPFIDVLSMGVPPRSRSSLALWQRAMRDLVSAARSNRMAPEALAAHAAASVDSLAAVFGGPSGDGDARDLSLTRGLPDLATQLQGLAHESKAAAGRAEVVADLAAVAARGGTPSWKALVSASGKLSAKKLQDVVGEFRAQVARHPTHPRLHFELDTITRSVFAHSAEVLVRYDERKAVDRLVDFDDMLALAVDVLLEDSVAERLRQRLDLVLIDEFQDTSPVQLKVIMALSQLARRALWVGDRKQSIFSFQGADPDLMEAASAAVLDGGSPEILPTNYRSRPPLVRLSSAVFSRAFLPHGLSVGEVVAQPACPDPPALVDDPVLEVWAIDKPERRRWWDLSAGTARLVRQLLDEGVAVRERVDDPTIEAPVRPVTAGDVAVLSPTNAGCRSIARALAAVGLRARVSRGGLGETAEAWVLRSALAVLADPRDRLAAVEVAWFMGSGVVDPDVWLAERITEWTAKRADEGSEIPIDPHVQSLLDLAGSARHLAPSEAVDAVLSRLDLPRFVQRWAQPRRRLANLEALRGLARDYEQTCRVKRTAATIGGLVMALDELTDDAGQATPADPDAITVLTWHKSKGLEWPVVILAGLDHRREGSPFDVRVISAPQFDARLPLAGRELRWWPWPYGDMQKDTVGGELAAASPEARDIAEADMRELVRLLYVGFTRARDRLVVCARSDKQGRARLGALVDGTGRPVLTLPWDAESGPAQADVGGQQWPCRVRRSTAEPAGFARVEAPSIRWFSPERAPLFPPPPRTLRPSSLDLPEDLAARVVIGEVRRLGRRQPLSVATARMAAVGNAIHGFLAADPGLSGDRELRDRLARRQLDAWDVGDVLVVQQLLYIGNALDAWVTEQVGGGPRLREWPIRWHLPSHAGSRLMVGEIDLLLPTDDGAIIVDHKSFPGDEAARDRRLVHYAAQLSAYAAAVEQATGQAVRSTWVHLPIRGEIVEVQVPRDGGWLRGAR